MSHEIEIGADGKACAFFVKQPAWHGLGVILQNPPTSKEAIIAAGLNWEVEKRPLFWQKGAPPILTKVESRVGLVRNTDEAILAVVSDQYEPLQNVNAFEFFDPYITAGVASYEAAGSLRGGQRIWVLAKLNQQSFQIGPNDELKNHLLLTSGNDGKTGVIISNVQTRVVCANTLRAALGEGGYISFWHTAGVTKNLEKAKEQLGLVVGKLDEIKDLYQRMYARSMSVKEIIDFVNKLAEYEVPQMPRENEHADGEKVDRANLNAKAMVDKILELLDTGFGHDMPGISGTLWGVYNAAIEFVDYYAGARSKDRGNYMLFGPGATLKEKIMVEAKALLVS